jgi:hypothetical protein
MRDSRTNRTQTADRKRAGTETGVLDQLVSILQCRESRATPRTKPYSKREHAEVMHTGNLHHLIFWAKPTLQECTCTS